MHQQHRAFSLFELLLTLALIAVLAGLALPAFAAIAARSRLHTEMNALFHAVHLARKESILRRRVVSICPSADGKDCAGTTDWSPGWIMFANLDGDDPPVLDPGEPVLEHHGVRPEVRITSNRRGFTLRATQKRATNGTLVVCDRSGRVPARALVVSYTGRPRVALSDRSGKAYACAD